MRWEVSVPDEPDPCLIPGGGTVETAVAKTASDETGRNNYIYKRACKSVRMSRKRRAIQPRSVAYPT